MFSCKAGIYSDNDTDFFHKSEEEQIIQKKKLKTVAEVDW